MAVDLLRIAKFILVGIWNTAFDLGLFWVFINTLNKIKLTKNLPIRIATLSHILSFLIANAVSYILNSIFTFRDSATNRGWVPYLSVSIFSLAVSTLLIQYFTQPKFYTFTKVNVSRISILHKRLELSEKQYALGIKLCTVVVTMITNYLGYSFFVF